VNIVRRPLIATLLAASCILGGCQSRTPGAAETTVMTWMKRKILVGNKKAANPLPPTPENIRAGQIAFSHYCFSCHGLDGQNTGVPFAATVAPPVPSLNSPQVQKYTDGQLKSVIANGIFPSGMPASKDLLSDEEIWSIVVYLRHLPPKGSLGEPAAYSDEEVTRLKSSK
jgi:mono/diheme cytochrome c family protein